MSARVARSWTASLPMTTATAAAQASEPRWPSSRSTGRYGGAGVEVVDEPEHGQERGRAEGEELVDAGEHGEHGAEEGEHPHRG